ncbi:MAG TPA: alpha-L-fucosidase, partial [Draconibacterium sp.]|nr:alpha-L-fucosidase [Draconibacterium sp.]
MIWIMVKPGVTIVLLIFSLFVIAQTPQTSGSTELNLNKPDRVEWYHNLGFGMLIELSFDIQLGIELSQSMLGASDSYLDRYINELPQTFNPKDFNATEIAKLAKLAGMKYIILTAKHHSGFCMWDTETTEFNIMETPYGKDLIAEYVDAVREAGLAVGLYFSPVDYNFLHENRLPVKQSFNNEIPAYIMTRYQELNELQTIELMAKYGDIDILFYVGKNSPLTEKCK